MSLFSDVQVNMTHVISIAKSV